MQCLDNYGLKPCTAEYLERMRQVVWRDNLDIKCLFEKHDPLEWGNVSGIQPKVPIPIIGLGRRKCYFYCQENMERI